MNRFQSRARAALICALMLLAATSSARAADAPFLWRVEGAVTHYLMGSVHVLPRSVYPLPPAMDKAYVETEVLVLETDITALNAPATQLSMVSAGMSEAGLAAEVGPQLHGRVREGLSKSGLPEFLCDAFRAWMCAVTLSVQPFMSEGMDPNMGLDMHFATRARRDGRKLVPLEAVEEQLQIISGMPPEMATRFLQSSLDDLDNPAMRPRAMIDAWRNNEVDAMTRIVDDMRRDYPVLYQRLLAQRNRAWLPTLQNHLRGQTPTLVVVGAAHLIGPDGLVSSMRRAGFRVSAVADD